MQIYAVADIHGKSDRIALIKEALCHCRPDALVVAGDVTNYSDSAAVIEQFNNMPVPVLAIRGNTDLPIVDRLLEHYPNTASLHLKKHEIAGVGFIGVSGTIPVPFSSRISIREKKIMGMLSAMINDNTVLVAHPPPWGVLDHVFGRFHAGCRRLHRLVVQYQPRLLLCGHIHGSSGAASIGKTRVVNCCVTRNSRGAKIEFDSSNGSLKIEML
jgi:Icc-related predicted phosphoesterase